MSDQKTGAADSPRWFVYFVIVAMGVAFTMTLVTISWNNALERTERDFSLASQTLKDNVMRNISIGHNTIKSLSGYIGANTGMAEQQFDAIASSLLQEHAYINGIVYCAFSGDLRSEGNIDTSNSPFSLRYQTRKDQVKLKSCNDVFPEQYPANIAAGVLESERVRTVADVNNQGENRNYWMLRRVTDGNAGEVAGFVAMLVDIHGLLGGEPVNTDLSITLLSDSTNLGGRQLLYRQARNEDVSWSATRLNEDTIAQFPAYSVKLSISKTVRLGEVDKELVYNSILIGIGVTMLMIALVRARDKQEQQLRERNIVIEKQVEQQTKELALARDKALEASQVKSAFLASMSHEIRTPLNAIIGMSELLSETPLNNEQKKYTDIFRKSGDTLLSLVNDILDLSKIEAGQLELEEIDFDFVEILEESLEIYALKAAEKQIELYCEIEPAISQYRIGDPARLRQIILNLISNALKFTDNGEIVVSAVRKQNIDNEDYIHFSVSDTGIGIPEDKLQSIFESFSQVDSSTTRKYGGTGLGLSICQSLVELMHGEIWVESELGRGSRFQFTARLPLSEKAPAESPDFQGRKMLIVDDSATARRVFGTSLESAGAVLEKSDSAASALQILESRADFDVVLVDYHMPGMDGLALSEKIKSQNPAMLVLLMIDGADLHASVKEGAGKQHDGYLVKPIKQKELFRQLTDLLFKPQKPAASEGSDKPADYERPLRILLVDDNADNRLLVKAYLKKLPYEMDEAENGEQAVSKFQETNYDIVLMDVQMPVMDGRTATRQIREWEERSGKTPVPIVALTAHAIREEIDECLQAGCTSHLGKPVKKATLIETIQQYT